MMALQQEKEQFGGSLFCLLTTWPGQHTDWCWPASRLWACHVRLWVSFLTCVNRSCLLSICWPRKGMQVTWTGQWQGPDWATSSAVGAFKALAVLWLFLLSTLPWPGLKSWLGTWSLYLGPGMRPPRHAAELPTQAKPRGSGSGKTSPSCGPCMTRQYHVGPSPGEHQGLQFAFFSFPYSSVSLGNMPGRGRISDKQTAGVMRTRRPHTRQHSRLRSHSRLPSCTQWHQRHGRKWHSLPRRRGPCSCPVITESKSFHFLHQKRLR